MRRMIIALALVLIPTTAHRALAAVLVVHPDGSGPYPTIQHAVYEAAPGDIIELTDGTYRGEGNRDVVFDGKAVTVRSQSDNPEACTIACEGTDEDTHRGFIFSDGEGPTTVLRGVTVSGALVNGC